VNRALDLGVNFIDTADTYGDGASEEILGRALAKRRREVVLATKTGGRPDREPSGRLSGQRIHARVDSSLRRLRTDYIDLFYFHRPDPGSPIEESLRAVDELLRAGKIRAFALSNYAAWQIAEIVCITDRNSWSSPVAAQVHYNLLRRTAEDEVVPACRNFGMSVVPYYPLAGGFLTGKYGRGNAPPSDTRFGRPPDFEGAEILRAPINFDRLERLEAFAKSKGRTVGELAIAWLLAQPSVCSVIAGATGVSQLEANVGASTWRLSAADLLEIDAVSKQLV
jgi:aryl-alcohol dehydrogenase-like predicted oxidoreductase